MGVIAKYKFNNTLEANLLPEFNSEFTSDLYTVTDEVNGEVTTRTIESDSLPTLMRFGRVYVEGESTSDNRTDSLLEVLEMNTSGLTNCNNMFRYCKNLTSISCEWDTSNVTNMYGMFHSCSVLTTLDVSNFNTNNVTTMDRMFTNCYKLTSLDVSNFNTDNVTDMGYMFNNCNNLISLDVSNFDTSNVTNMSYMFANCINLTSLDVSNFDTNNVTTMDRMFYKCRLLTTLDISNWNTSKVTNMQEMFYECYVLTQINQTNLVTSASLSTNRLFYGCKLLTSLDVSNWNTSNVKDMNRMFNSCNKLTSLDVSNWDTINVTDMSYMFFDCNNLTTLDVSNFNTSNVKNMNSMFNNCTNLTTLDVSNWNTINVTDMEKMFHRCQKLTLLDVSSWDTSKVTNINGIFYNCISLTELDVSNWNTSNVVKFSTGYGVFQDTGIRKLDLRNWDIKKADYLWNTFFSSKLEILDISNWDLTDKDVNNIFAQVTTLKYLKCNNVDSLNKLSSQLPTKSSASQGTIICKSDITNLDITSLQSKYWNILDEPTLIAKYVFDKSIHNNCIPGFNTELNIEFEGYFIEDEVEEENNEVTRTIESCGMLPIRIQFGNSDGQKDFNRRMSLLKILNICEGLIYCPDMFAQCENLLSVCDIDTSNVTTMYCMFYNCKSLTSLDVSNFNTSKVTDMMYLFNNCTNLTTLDVSNWDTSKVITMHGIFSNCINLTSLDVSNFDTGNVTDMGWMFNHCTKLTSLDVSNFNTSKVTRMDYMFYNTLLLTDISVLYMDKSSLQKLIDVIPTDSNKTLWYKDVNIDGITHGDNITLKKYMEGNVEIVLNSPLLKGDTIEVVDGKLCHVHKMGSIILDKNYKGYIGLSGTLSNTIRFYVTVNTPKEDTHIVSNSFLSNIGYNTDYTHGYTSASEVYIFIKKDKLSTQDVDGFRQWLSENPTAVIYQLAEPYYEDITNLQSAPTLKTYLECSMEIDTDLPIDTNVTYRTNLSSVYVMERELDELDNGTDLGDILEGEVNE